MNDTRPARWLWTVAAVAVAGVVGYALARWTSPSAIVPAIEAAAPARDTLTIDGAFLATMGIEVAPAARGDLAAEIDVPGTVTAAPNGQASVTTHAAGTVARLDKRLGDVVAAGDVLALLDSNAAATIAADRTAAEAKAALAQSVLKRERDLFAQHVTPRQDLETAEAEAAAADAEAARARTAFATAHVSSGGRTLAVVTPIAGRITSTKAALGVYVTPDMELFRVADPRFVVIEASLPPADARRVAAGDTAQVTAGGMHLTATVLTVTPTVDAQSGVATATFALAAGQATPTPGEFARVRIAPSSSSAATTTLVVPDEAVQSVDSRDVVFVRIATGFRLQPVVVGARSGGRAAVVSGLQPGEMIATTNAFLLKAEVGKGAEEDE